MFGFVYNRVDVILTYIHFSISKIYMRPVLLYVGNRGWGGFVVWMIIRLIMTFQSCTCSREGLIYDVP